MNANELDFQGKLTQIGNLYEDGKDALNAVPFNEDINKAFECLRGLRDIAAMACKAAYKIQEN
jgi:hypothetical protein